MERFRIIDADSLEEVTEIWDHLDPAFQSRRPFPVTVEKNIGHTNLNAFWYIDGAAVPKLEGPGTILIATPLTSTYAQSKPFSVGSQGLTDVKARLKDCRLTKTILLGYCPLQIGDAGPACLL